MHKKVVLANPRKVIHEKFILAYPRKFPASNLPTIRYDWLCHFATFLYKGVQGIKPIIVVKVSYKLLYITQVKDFLIMSNSLALLDIRAFGCLYNIAASDWPRTFLTARLFLFSI